MSSIFIFILIYSLCLYRKIYTKADAPYLRWVNSCEIFINICFVGVIVDACGSIQFNLFLRPVVLEVYGVKLLKDAFVPLFICSFCEIRNWICAASAMMIFTFSPFTHLTISGVVMRDYLRRSFSFSSWNLTKLCYKHHQLFSLKHSHLWCKYGNN